MNKDLNPYAPPAADGQMFEGPPEVWLRDHLWRERDLLVIGRGAELRPRCFVTGADTTSSAQVSSYWQPRWIYSLLLLWGVTYFVIAPFFRRHIRLQVPIAADLLAKRRRQSMRAAFVALYALVGLWFLYQWQAASVWFLPLFCSLIVLFFVSAALARAPLVGLQIERIDDQVLVLRNLPRRCLEGLPEWPHAESVSQLPAIAGNLPLRQSSE